MGNKLQTFTKIIALRRHFLHEDLFLPTSKFGAANDITEMQSRSQLATATLPRKNKTFDRFSKELLNYLLSSDYSGLMVSVLVSYQTLHFAVQGQENIVIVIMALSDLVSPRM